MAIAAAASGFPGFARWTFACGHGTPGLLQVRPATYTPQFFSADEYATVERLAEIIVPSDEGPGAREAGVSEFVDFMAASNPKMQYPFRYGLTWLDAHAPRATRRTSFASWMRGAATDLLEPLAYKRPPPSRRRGGPRLFQADPRLHAHGVLHLEGGLAAARLPGPAQPLPGNCRAARIRDDPEHRRLPGPKA